MAIGTPVLQQTAGAVSTSCTTASFTPPANCILFAWAGNDNAGTDPDDPVVSDSLSGSWTAIGSAVLNNVKGKLFAQQIGGSPSARAITNTSADAARCTLITFSVTGVSMTLTNWDGGTSTTGDPSFALPNAPAASSAGVYCVMAESATNYTPATGFTELYDAEPVSSRRNVVAYDLTSPVQNLSVSSGNTDVAGVYVELVEDTAGAGITGSASITEAGDTVSATASLALSASLAATEQGDSLSATATLRITGAASITQEGDSTSASSAPAIASSSSPPQRVSCGIRM